LESLPVEQLQQILDARVLSAHRLIGSSVPLLKRSGGRILAIFPPSAPGSRIADAGIKALLDNLRQEVAHDHIGISVLEHGRPRVQRRGSMLGRRQSEAAKMEQSPRRGSWVIPTLAPSAITDAAMQALQAKHAPPYFAIGMDVKLQRIARFFRGT
jgi:NAD(P)-dependent dehydrogenase (short-subunit alcohol dehydrogenase family)